MSCRVYEVEPSRGRPQASLPLVSPHARATREEPRRGSSGELSRSRRGIRCVLVIAGRNGRSWCPCETTRSTTRHERKRDKDRTTGSRNDRSATCLARCSSLPQQAATCENSRLLVVDVYVVVVRAKLTRGDRHKRTNRTN